MIPGSGTQGGTGTIGSSSGAGGSSSAATGSGGIDISSGSGATGGVNPDDACAVDSAEPELVTLPVDIIMVLDNSGSMEDELESVEQNINVNFADILTQSGVDYRLILISRHRVQDRCEDGDGCEEASTSICVSAPLSALPSCPFGIPGTTDRFYQYSVKIESEDSFDRILETYNSSSDDKYNLSTMGWSEWLRPGAKKVFLEMTDDNEDMSAEAFMQALSSRSTEHFGTPEAPNYIFHSIIGVQEKNPVGEAYLPSELPVNMPCTGNGNTVTTTGLTYQDLSIRTGGLRFPICEFPSYDTVFRRIAEDVVVTSSLKCDFAVPAPPQGKTLELDKVAVNYTPGAGGNPQQFGQALLPTDCQANAFYIEGDRIYLCPDACTSIQNDPQSRVDVLFTCDSTIIVR
jgi:hypothetical protein